MGYIDDVMRAVDGMEGRLTEPITLQEVAAWAGYSPYHFHRLFQALTGLTIGAYLRGRRLAEAATILAGSRKRVLDVALEYQFQSQEGFARAFARAYGMTPQEYRKSRLTAVPYPRPRITREVLVHLKEGISMNPKIVSKGKIRLVGMVYHGDNQKSEISALWTRFNPRMCAVGTAKEEGAYGVCFNDNRGDQTFTYMASVEVDSLEDVPMDMVGKTLPANTYAVFTHKGSLDNLRKTYEYIYGTWLPNSDYVSGGDYDFELYDARFKPGSDQSELDIYLPVKARVK